MNEENKIDQEETQTVAPAPETEAVAEPAPVAEPQPVEEPAPQPAEEPQVIVQKERGFAHYVGFALLCVLCICFFFMPGIALTFGVSRLVALNGTAAWIFSAIFSFVVWLIFKLKIKGFKKSFYWYIGLCVVMLAILIAIEVLTENLNVFSSIFALLTDAAA